MPTAAIMGTGLIGTSIGFGLTAQGWDVEGWDPVERAALTALQRGALTSVVSDQSDLLQRGCDLLVLASPPQSTESFVATSTHCGLTMDTAGVKGEIVLANRMPRFVATHPMAGREVSGPKAATQSLFKGATWVICDDTGSREDISAVADIVRLFGARPVVMGAADHDRNVAAISHVPQLLAAALMKVAESRAGAMELAAGSFRDLTRVAGSEPTLWFDVLASNRKEVVCALADLQAGLSELSLAIEFGRRDELATVMKSARELRRQLTGRATAVRVALADKPGELASVGRAISAAGTDIRDIQLRHAPHGGGGVLTISVRPGDATALRDALAEGGLVLLDE